MNMKKLIIIPAFNEANNIENVFRDIKNNYPCIDVIVINDCSTDDTVNILDKLGINHIDLPVNLGIGGGVQTGYIYALNNNYDIAVQFDGDGQHDAKYLHSLISAVESGEADVAIGSRFVDGQGFQSTVLRRTGIKILSGIIKGLSGVYIKDVTSGMRAVDRKMIEYYSANYAQDYPEPEAILSAGYHGAVIKEIPVEMHERISGKSSINAIKSIYYMIKVSLALLLFSASRGRKQ